MKDRFVDKASATSAGLTTDLNGSMRIQNGTVDLGVYEGGVNDCFNILYLKNLTLSPISCEANQNILWMGKVDHMSMTTLSAKQSIDLLEGFEVELGSVLIIDLTGCDP